LLRSTARTERGEGKVSLGVTRVLISRIDCMPY